MPPRKEPTIFVARTSGVVKIKGKQHTFIAGRTRIRDGHPLLKAAPDHFIPMQLDYDVEQATAAPGEQR